ncbi:hypothetical protein CEXT_445101 [Caerostris extrusa]|uniref:Cytochrome c biogenesis B n=1 Tax=Caerostris extrusa TaxID=172846 RepID=A0AAV4XD40_CAEEX|nr:hypothetical protein CEXT_445101 [Caerostris extrusa]
MGEKLFNRVVLFPPAATAPFIICPARLGSRYVEQWLFLGFDSIWMGWILGRRCSFFSGKGWVLKGSPFKNFCEAKSQNRVLVYDRASVNPGVFRSEVKRVSLSLSVRLFDFLWRSGHLIFTQIKPNSSSKSRLSSERPFLNRPTITPENSFVFIIAVITPCLSPTLSGEL